MLSHFDSNDISAKRFSATNMRQTGTMNAPQMHMTIDQQLQLMNVINSMVKNGQFTTNLANTIFSLCQQLKVSGMMLEQSHKAELNKVFISLRQACCRDNGQLGTPCRLKIMELVELRAMHWRTNLAHSQYYVNRPEQTPDSLPPLASPQSLPSPASTMTFVPQTQLFSMHNDMSNTAAHHTSPYFLIPATVPGGFMNPLLPGLMQQPLFAPNMGHESVLMRQKSLKKPNPVKPLQLRHEMVIRNADSGKIMGVKGRRVALVEQITNTVISFQKVDAKSRERTLTITASTMEAIEHAKQLIEDTIRRNMSPSRPEHFIEDNVDEGDENDISIETTQDGVLKLCCSDPQVLQAAQEALSEYLRVRARPSAEEREKKKERRKSMPLQPTPAPTQKQPHPMERAKALGGSTPNLAEAAAAAALAASRIPAPYGPCYSREALLAVKKNTKENGNVREKVAIVAPELLR